MAYVEQKIKTNTRYAFSHLYKYKRWMSVPSGALQISGFQTNQFLNSLSFDSTRRGVSFPLTWIKLSEGSNPNLVVPLPFGNVSGVNDKFSSSGWMDQTSIWFLTSDSHLRTWDYSSRIWWYIRSNSLSLTRDVTKAASVAFLRAQSRSGFVIQDLNSRKFLDWASRVEKAPNDELRAGETGFGWTSSLFDGDDAWNVCAMGEPDPAVARILVDPCGSVESPHFARADWAGLGQISASRVLKADASFFGLQETFLAPLPPGVLRFSLRPLDSGLALTLNPSRTGLRLAPVTFFDSGRQPTRAFVLFYDPETSEVFFEPDDFSRKRYSLSFGKTPVTPANFDPSSPVPVGLTLSSCDQNFASTTCQGFEAPEGPESYQRFRIAQEIQGMDWSLDQRFRIQDTITGLCVSTEDFSLVPATDARTVLSWVDCLILEEAQQEGIRNFTGGGDGVFATFPVNPCNVDPLDPPAESAAELRACCENLVQVRETAVPNVFSPASNAPVIGLGCPDFARAGESSRIVLSAADGDLRVWGLAGVARSDRLFLVRPTTKEIRPVGSGRAISTGPGWKWIFLLDPPVTGPLATLIYRDFVLAVSDDVASSVGVWELVRIDFRVDSTVCGLSRCGWGEGCSGYFGSQGSSQSGIQDYCSGATRSGLARLTSDENCSTWCRRDPGKVATTSRCLVASAPDFCESHPGDPQCLCMRFETTEIFRRLFSVFEAIEGCPECKVIPPPVCWAQPCTIGNADQNSQVFDDRMTTDRQNCGPITLTFCQQVISFVKNTGNITVNNVDFAQVCGEKLASELPQSDGSAGTQANVDAIWIQDNVGAFVGALSVIIVGLAVLLVFLVLIFRQRASVKSSFGQPA